MVKKQSHCQPSLWSFRPQICRDFLKYYLGCWIWILESRDPEYKIRIFSSTTYWWIRSCRMVIERHCQSRKVLGSILASSDTSDEAESTKRRRKNKKPNQPRSQLSEGCITRTVLIFGAEIQPKHLVFCYLGFFPGFSLVSCFLPHPMHSRF